MDANEKTEPVKGWTINTPIGKPKKLKRAIPAGSLITFTTRDGKTAVKVEEGKESGVA